MYVCVWAGKWCARAVPAVDVSEGLWTMRSKGGWNSLSWQLTTVPCVLHGACVPIPRMRTQPHVERLVGSGQRPTHTCKQAFTCCRNTCRLRTAPACCCLHAATSLIHFGLCHPRSPVHRPPSSCYTPRPLSTIGAMPRCVPRLLPVEQQRLMPAASFRGPAAAPALPLAPRQLGAKVGQGSLERIRPHHWHCSSSCGLAVPCR